MWHWLYGSKTLVNTCNIDTATNNIPTPSLQDLEQIIWRASAAPVLREYLQFVESFHSQLKLRCSHVHVQLAVVFIQGVWVACSNLFESIPLLKSAEPASCFLWTKLLSRLLNQWCSPLCLEKLVQTLHWTLAENIWRSSIWGERQCSL